MLLRPRSGRNRALRPGKPRNGLESLLRKRRNGRGRVFHQMKPGNGEIVFFPPKRQLIGKKVALPLQVPLPGKVTGKGSFHQPKPCIGAVRDSLSRRRKSGNPRAWI